MQKCPEKSKFLQFILKVNTGSLISVSKNTDNMLLLSTNIVSALNIHIMYEKMLLKIATLNCVILNIFGNF